MEGRRYLGLDVLARNRITLNPSYTTPQDLIHAQRNLRATTTAPANHCADTATRVGIFDE